MENIKPEPLAPFHALSPKDRFDTAPQPNDPPWGILSAIAVWVVSVLLIIVMPAVFVLPYMGSLGRSFADAESAAAFLKSDPIAIILQIAAVFPAHLLTIILAFFVVTRMRTYPFRETLGWNTGGVRWWNYVAILAGFFLISMVVGSYFPEKEDDLLRIVRSSTTAAVLIAVMAVFTAPIVEEVVYRGLLYSAFQRTVGNIAAVLIVTLLFTSVHIPQYYQNPSKIAMLALLSLIITLLRSFSGNLLPAIILHTVFNSLSAVTLLAERFTNAVPLPVEAPAAAAVPWLTALLK